MPPRLRPIFILLTALPFAGCGTGRRPQTISRPAKILTPPIRTVQKWNPLWSFGNADDPEPPAWFRPGSPNRRWLWHVRNPLHNFTHYVIGVTDKDITRTGKYPAQVFAPDGGWNWALTRHRWLPLPFLSFDGKCCRCYLGWRESGNFGGKIQFRHRTPVPERKQPSAMKST